MISQLWKNAIEAISPNVTVFSQSDADRIVRVIEKTIQLTPRQYVDWNKYQPHVTSYGTKEAIATLEKLLQRPITETNTSVYAIFVFESFSTVIKTDIITLLQHYRMVRWNFSNIIIWNPAEGYAIENHRLYDFHIGLAEKGGDPAPEFTFKKNMLFYSFMRHKGPFHELTRAFGLEIFADDEANTILAKFQSMLPFTMWRCIDWDKIEKKIFVGKDENNVLPALYTLLKKPFDTEIYICLKQPEAPLMRINLTPETARYRLIWSRACGTFLFNLEERYVIEVDLQGNIMVGLIPERAV